MAFLFRSAGHRLLVVTDLFGTGEVTIIPYHEFLSRPFIKMIKTRQIGPNAPPDLVKKSNSFI